MSNSWQLLLDCGWRWVDREEGKTLCGQINSDPYSGCSSETAVTTSATDLEIWNSGQLHKVIQEKGQVEDKSSGERQKRSGRKELHTSYKGRINPGMWRVCCHYGHQKEEVSQQKDGNLNWAEDRYAKGQFFLVLPYGSIFGEDSFNARDVKGDYHQTSTMFRRCAL